MAYLSIFLVVLVALEHFYIMVLEMFFWTKPRTMKTFGISKELAEQTTAMAANQGLYNGFLATGLVCGLLYPNAVFGFCLLYTSPSPRDLSTSRMPSSA